jgi:HemK-like putative methylase
VSDWREVERIARLARVQGAVASAMAPSPTPPATGVLDGAWGRVVSISTWIGRGHFISAPARTRIREWVSLQRERFGMLPLLRTETWEVHGLAIRSPRGVFRPWELSRELARAGLASIEAQTAPVVVDLGTGSGAAALLIARERPDAQVIGTDVSWRAVRSARENARDATLGRVRFLQGDLLDALPASLAGKVALIVTNLPTDPPPTVRDRHKDPRGSLVGVGSDGQGLIRRVIIGAKGILAPKGRVAMMLRPWQWEVLLPELEAAGYAQISVTPSNVTSHVFCCVEWGGPS